MLKTILLAGTMAIAAPAVAQTQAPAAQTAPAATQAPAAPATTTAMPAPSQPAAVPAQGTPAPATAATPAPASTQVAQVVDQQFATYDKDANGSLSKAEFSSWMTALKTQANAKEGDPAKETAWNDAAFKQADGDKSSTVTKVELTGFLVKGASGAS